MRNRFSALMVTACLGTLLCPLAFVPHASAAPMAAFAAADSVSATDADFLKRAVMSDHAAIDAGNIVLQRSSNDHLKQIAKTVVDTHTKMLEQLETEAKKSNVSVSEGGSPAAKAMCSKLEAASGKKLDTMFINGMLKLHNEELSLFKTEGAKTASPELKQISQDQVPVIEQHIADLKGIQKNGL